VTETLFQHRVDLEMKRKRQILGLTF